MSIYFLTTLVQDSTDGPIGNQTGNLESGLVSPDRQEWPTNSMLYREPTVPVCNETLEYSKRIQQINLTWTPKFLNFRIFPRFVADQNQRCKVSFSLPPGFWKTKKSKKYRMSIFTCFERVDAEFLLINQNQNFDQAENLCADNNATLASVRSLDEFNFIRDNVPGTLDVERFWIGKTV